MQDGSGIAQVTGKWNHKRQPIRLPCVVAFDRAAGAYLITIFMPKGALLARYLQAIDQMSH